MTKRISLLGLVLLATTILTFARTPEQAAQVASQFWAAKNVNIQANAKRQAPTMAQPVKLAFTQQTADQNSTALYVFNNNDEGFVIVSAEDDARAVLGYSDTGSFDANNIPPGLAFWLQMYADEIAAYQAAPKSETAAEEEDEEEEYVFTPVEPIIEEVQWGQGVPYNSLVPTVNETKCPAGCVAVALGQIMYAHKYPTQGTGMHAYTTITQKIQLSVNFGDTRYEWDKILPRYTLGEYSAENTTAVATLLYHLGVAVDMDYNPHGSGAFSNAAIMALIRYFGYDEGIEILLKDYMDEEDILDYIAADLAKGNPVYVSGSTVNNEGHAFVCDGIREDGYMHINWGWDGSSNGYYALSALHPKEQGTGGSASGLSFTKSVEVYTGIQPEQGGSSKPVVTISDFSFSFESKEPQKKNKPIMITMDDLQNSGYIMANGKVVYHLLNENGEVAQSLDLVDTRNIMETFRLNLAVGYVYTKPTTVMNTGAIKVPDGQYFLTVMVEQDEHIVPIWMINAGQIYIPVLVKGDEYILNNAQGEGWPGEEEPSAVEDVQAASTVYLYDIFGRMVDSQSAKMERAWNVPANGIYIQKQGEKTSKVSL